jgi:hypothetical protein
MEQPLWRWSQLFISKVELYTHTHTNRHRSLSVLIHGLHHDCIRYPITWEKYELHNIEDLFSSSNGELLH